ncbi:Histidine kinase-, DNA gyrase B-, and HSP90-like ATPase [Saccharopolyspora antimicrobica]|uniref:Histidine kinase-, DNA gyrase B-, and HSP90-like ATPase n=2 Tax=Saccharopolyspora antimicrobica TaxID=455193 RepID=A0A1I4X157_9PSEU|nr:histidine kinase/DNA gyrase B/HSP90-like ATPase [Saccharopolyspora antimicrobica]SFN19734.1 Histidine kinase-, DNA gyrase B-, and HSP90-like ATPase [Saccharopolyspora antimicrobica]
MHDMDSSLARRMLAASTEITRVALSAEDPDAVLPLVVRRAAELAEADLGVVTVRADDGRLTVEAAYGAPSATGPLGDPVGTVLSSRSAAARVARSGVPVVVDDLIDDPLTAPYVPAALRVYGPFAVAPFGTRERRLGALAVYRRRGASTFTRVAVDVLTSFAAQAGLALVLAEGSTARQRIAVYQERERIARDLHDVIVQRLYATGVQLEVLERRLSGQLAPADASRLSETMEQIDQAIAEVRATARTLRSADPETPDHAPALDDSMRSEVQIAGELLGRPPRLEIEGDLSDVPVQVADHARAALREALSNVVRHAGAKTVLVRVRRSTAGLLLQVVDDGCGIPRDVSKRGLRNLEERAVAAGGRCVLTSSPDSGTTVTWEVPLNAAT